VLEFLDQLDQAFAKVLGMLIGLVIVGACLYLLFFETMVQNWMKRRATAQRRADRLARHKARMEELEALRKLRLAEHPPADQPARPRQVPPDEQQAPPPNANRPSP
jgi:hypothetical protein